MLEFFVQILVDSGYIGLPELGKLAQLSRKLKRATIKDDSVWASMCQRDFPNTQHIPKQLLQKMGHRWLYLQWKHGVAPRRKPRRKLSPPSCSVGEVEFHVQITYKKRPLVSVCVFGEHMLTFLKNGHFDASLRKPAILGKAQWDTFTDEEKEDYRNGTLEMPLQAFWNDFDQREFDVSIHMFRHADSSMCCVFSPPPGDRECLEGVYVHPKQGDKELTPQTEFDLDKEQQWSSLNFGPWSPDESNLEGLPLRQTPLAAEIKNRLSNPIVFSFDCSFGIVEGGHFALTGFLIEAMKMSSTDEDAHPEQFEASKEEKKHGVTLLHILSELQNTTISRKLYEPPPKKKKRKRKRNW